MGKHISDSLCSPRLRIISSDEDQPIVADLYVGYNFNGELAACIDLHDYDEPEYNCSTAVFVNRDDSGAMARRHRVKHAELPSFISKCMEDWSEVINPTIEQVIDCFKEITECLLDEGCRFRLERTYGKNRHRCC